MNYAKSAYNKVVAAYNNLRQLVQNAMIFPGSGLEYAVAGMPNGFSRESDVSSALDNYQFQKSGIREVYEVGNKITVIRSTDGRQIHLNPGSVRHDSEGYIQAVLSNNGIHVKPAKLKKLAKILDVLRGNSKQS